MKMYSSRGLSDSQVEKSIFTEISPAYASADIQDIEDYNVHDIISILYPVRNGL